MDSDSTVLFRYEFRNDLTTFDVYLGEEMSENPLFMPSFLYEFKEGEYMLSRGAHQYITKLDGAS